MINEFSRTELLIGTSAIEKLKNSKVAIFGIGGVGGHVAEAIVRSGVGTVHFFDSDVVSLSNINRQIVALHSTIGMKKVEIMKNRALDINPNLNVEAFDIYFDQNSDIDFSNYHYIIDAIDTVPSKVELIKRAKAANVPVISSMGAGNKLDPTGFMVADISKTEVCPLARIMRKKLKDLNIKKVKVVYSKEIAIVPLPSEEVSRRPIPGSCAFVPSVVGLIIASEVIKDLSVEDKI